MRLSGLQAARPHRRALCQPDALAAAGAGDLLVLLPGALYRAWLTGASRPISVGAFTSSLITFIMFEAAYFSEIMRAGIQSISQGPAGRGAGARPDLLPDHALRRAAAGVPQHAAGAADPDHRAVPGHLAGLCALDPRFPRRGQQGRAARRPAGRDVSVRGGGLFHDLLLSHPSASGACRRASPFVR